MSAAQSDKSDFDLGTIKPNPLPPFCSTPVHIARLEKELTSHPEREFVASLLHDLTFSFGIGHNGPQFPRLVQNLLSVRNNPKVVQDYLEKEVSQNGVARPVKSPPLQNLQCSPISLVPKKDRSWQMPMDLFTPKGFSINDFISQEEFSVIYSKFDDAVNMIAKLGPGALMAKPDIKSVFRLCSVRPEDWELSGIYWEGHYYVELRLHLVYGPVHSTFVVSQMLYTSF